MQTTNITAEAQDSLYWEMDYICSSLHQELHLEPFSLPLFLDRSFLKEAERTDKTAIEFSEDLTEGFETETEATETEATETEIAEANVRSGLQVSNIIFVGDSRVVGMAGIGGYHYVGLSGSGYNWFSSDGLSYLYQQMANYPDADIVLCFGVNDVNNISSYISLYNDLITSNPDRRFWIMSVNPCADEAAASGGYFIQNSMIDEFNSIMSEAFPERYLDVNGYLWKYGFGTVDGVHYDYGTYLIIQEYSKFLIQNKLDNM